MAKDKKKIELSPLSKKFIELLESKRGLPSKMARAINKRDSFFSEIKRNKPVNAEHLRAVGLICGPKKVIELLSIDAKTPPESYKSGSNAVFVSQGGIVYGSEIENFRDKERIHCVINNLAYLESAAPDKYDAILESIFGAYKNLKLKESKKTANHI